MSICPRCFGKGYFHDLGLAQSGFTANCIKTCPLCSGSGEYGFVPDQESIDAGFKNVQESISKIASSLDIIIDRLEKILNLGL